jgi:hypothetical protein
MGLVVLEGGKKILIPKFQIFETCNVDANKKSTRAIWQHE